MATLGIIALAVIGGFLSLAGRVAHAASPVHQVFDVNDTHLAPKLSAFCGFPIRIHEEGRITDIFHTDNAGNFVEAGAFRVDNDGNLIFQVGPFDYHDGDWQPVCALPSN